MTIIKPEKPQSKDAKQRTAINGDIRAREVRLIDKDGEQVGVVTLREALSAAEAVQ